MVRAIRFRNVAALYVDACAFAALWQSASWLAARGRVTWVYGVVTFALLEVSLVRRRTLGRWALGAASSDESWRSGERWWTLMVGLLGLAEGLKECTRWTYGLPPPPFMGLPWSWDHAAAIVTTSGILTMIAAVGVLRCDARAALLGIVVMMLSTASWLVGWRAMMAWVDARTIAAHAMRGLPTSEEQLALMRKVLPGGALFGSVVGSAWLTAAYVRFRRSLRG